MHTAHMSSFFVISCTHISEHMLWSWECLFQAYLVRGIVQLACTQYMKVFKFDVIILKPLNKVCDGRSSRSSPGHACSLTGRTRQQIVAPHSQRSQTVKPRSWELA
jgi:hypothetical protein